MISQAGAGAAVAVSCLVCVAVCQLWGPFVCVVATLLFVKEAVTHPRLPFSPLSLCSAHASFLTIIFYWRSLFPPASPYRAVMTQHRPQLGAQRGGADPSPPPQGPVPSPWQPPPPPPPARGRTQRRGAATPPRVTLPGRATPGT